MDDLLAAMAHPALFGPLFGGETWAAWRAFVAALFALPMDDAALALYRRHTERMTPPATPPREAALVCGRRAGKSRVLALIAVYLAAFRSYDEFTVPGEQPVVAVIAVDRKQARVILRYIVGMLRAVPALAAMVAEELAESVALTNGVVIEVHTCSVGSPRGRTFVAVLADEIAFWASNEDGANPDSEVIAAVRPGLASIPGSMLLMASSPYARRGVLWNTYRHGFGRDDARVLVWRGATLAMNPTLDPAVVAAAYEADPADAAAEYGAEFRNDVDAFVAREAVEACVEPGCRERAPARAAGRRYVAFVDAAGGSGSDAMTAAVAHLEDGVPVLDAVREVRPPFSPEAATAEFAVLLKPYRIVKAESDKWGGDWVGEAFRKHGITVAPSAAPKSDIYRELLPLLNARRCSLLDHPRLIAQLCGLERRTARGGRDSIDHAPGAHDDLANAAAGALVLAASRAAPVLVTAEALRRTAVPPAGGAHADRWRRWP